MFIVQFPRFLSPSLFLSSFLLFCSSSDAYLNQYLWVLLRCCRNEAVRERLHRPIWLRLIVRLALDDCTGDGDGAGNGNDIGNRNCGNGAHQGRGGSDDDHAISWQGQLLALRVLRYLLPALSPTDPVLLAAAGYQSGGHEAATLAPEDVFVAHLLTLIGRAAVESETTHAAVAVADVVTLSTTTAAAVDVSGKAPATKAPAVAATAAAASSKDAATSSSASSSRRQWRASIGAERVALLRCVLGSELWNAALNRRLLAHATELPSLVTSLNDDTMTVEATTTMTMTSTQSDSSSSSSAAAAAAALIDAQLPFDMHAQLSLALVRCVQLATAALEVLGGAHENVREGARVRYATADEGVLLAPHQ